MHEKTDMQRKILIIFDSISYYPPTDNVRDSP